MVQLLKLALLWILQCEIAWTAAGSEMPSTSVSSAEVVAVSEVRDAAEWTEATSAVDLLFASPTTRDRIGRVIAPVKINGSGPFRFIVDTGASHSVLSPELVGKLGLELSSAAIMSVNGVTGVTLAKTASLSRLEVGTMVLEKRQLPVLATMFTRADGVLGVDALDDTRITIDFVSDRVEILTADGKRAPRGFVVLPATFRFGQLLLVNARIGRMNVKAVIDTGAQATLGNNALREALRIGKGSRRPVVRTVVEGVTAAAQRGDMATVSDITLGSTVIAGPTVTFGDIYIFKLWNLEQEPALILGMDVLGTVEKLVIDYRRREVQLLPLKVRTRDRRSGRWLDDFTTPTKTVYGRAFQPY